MGPEQFLQRPRTMKLLALLFLAAVAYAEPEAKAEAEADPYLLYAGYYGHPYTYGYGGYYGGWGGYYGGYYGYPYAATVISGREMPVKNDPLLRARTLRPTLNSYMPTTTTMASLTAPTTTLPLSIITLMPLP